MKKALLISFDPATGKRAGGICIKNDDPANPNEPKCDKGLVCYGWQNLDCTPAKEIRLITDDRDIEQYRNVEGITILEGEEAINEAIRVHTPPRPAESSSVLEDEKAVNRVINLLFRVRKELGM